MENKEKKKARDKIWRQENRERRHALDKIWRESHKKEIQERQRKWVNNRLEESRNYARWYSIERKYGITEEDYNNMFTNQGGRCKICGRHQTEFNYRLYVDHDHATGNIRGLLCHRCNFMIGLAEDNKSLLLSAIEYLSNI
jgi:hypothetical protein